jgi:ADP-ribose pyrophosphatase
MSGEVQGRRRVYEGKVVTLELQQVQLEDGRVVQQEVVVHRPSVTMVPVDAQGRILFVRQYRAPAEADLLELPAGSIDPDEDVEAAVQRELQEEIGYRAGRLRRLSQFYLAPGYCTELMHAYVAEDLSEEHLAPDDDELIAVERLSLEEALERVTSGEIRDVKTIVGLLLYARTRRESAGALQ